MDRERDIQLNYAHFMPLPHPYTGPMVLGLCLYGQIGSLLVGLLGSSEFILLPLFSH